MRRACLTLLGLLVMGSGAVFAQPAPGGFVLPADGAAHGPIASPAAPDVSCLSDAWHWFTAQCDEPAHPSDRSWLRAEYLMWWTKNGTIPVPLVTTGTPTATIIGGLTQRGTHIIVGLTDQDYGTANGLRLDAGLWLDQDRCLGLQADYFLLERRATGIRVSSPSPAGGGYSVLAQPLTDPATGQEFTEVIALPGFLAGSSDINTHSRLQGGEFNLMTNYCSGDIVSAYLFAGFRALGLDEDVQMGTTLVPLMDEFLTFQGQPVNRPNTVTTLDKFQAQNRFYGGQVGGRLEFNVCRVNVSLLGQLAVGVSELEMRIAGSSSLITPTGTTTVPGGVLAVASNIGRYRRDEVGLVPGFGLQFGYQLCDHLEVRFGYSALWWGHVERPGKAIDTTVAPGLVPTDPLFGTAGGTRPAFQFRPSLYSAQGLTFGLTFLF